MLLGGEFGQNLPVVCNVHRDEKFSTADYYFAWKVLVMLKELQACRTGKPLVYYYYYWWIFFLFYLFTPGFEIFSLFKRGNRFVERCSAELFAGICQGAEGLDPPTFWGPW